MDIPWGNLVYLLYAIGILVGGSIVAMAIGVPIARLIEHLEGEDIGHGPDWENNCIFGWFIGVCVIGLVLLVLFMPRR
jgi:predicted MFS family arabinose efflux permease